MYWLYLGLKVVALCNVHVDSYSNMVGNLCKPPPQKNQNPLYAILFSYSLDHGVIRNDRVFDAMLATDRALYSTDHPYADSPQSIGTNFSHTHTKAKSR